MGDRKQTQKEGAALERGMRPGFDRSIRYGGQEDQKEQAVKNSGREHLCGGGIF
jgi:hypothetical protein